MLAIVLFWPFGVTALIYAVSADAAEHGGDVRATDSRRRTAQTLAIAGTIIGGLLLFAALLLLAFIGSNPHKLH